MQTNLYYSPTHGVYGTATGEPEFETDVLVPPRPEGLWTYNPALNDWQPEVPDIETEEEARANMAGLTNRQFKLLLVKNKHPQSKMVAAIAAIDDELMRDEYEINWAGQPYFSRVDPIVIMATQVYGLTDETMDLYWPEGHKL